MNIHVLYQKYKEKGGLKGMILLYSIDAQNASLPTERIVHCVDTDLADRFFVKASTQGDRMVRKLIEEIDDFIGDKTKDLTKPLDIMGLDGDAFGAKLVAELVRKQPVYVDVHYASAGRAFRR